MKPTQAHQALAFKGCILLVFFLLSGSTYGLTYRELLDGYTGNWQGKYVVKDSEGRIVKTLSAHLQYWWDGDIQRSLTVFDDSKQVSYSESTFYVSKGTLFADVRTGADEQQRFIGKVNHGAITWIPNNVIEAVGKQTMEYIRIKQGMRELVVQGYHTVKDAQGQKQRLDVSGHFIPDIP